jgi:transmembrane sensor
MKIEDQDELHIARQANMWRIRLRSEGRACHAAFTAWLLESSRHVKAYLMAVAIAKRLSGLDPRREIDVEALISEPEDCVVPLTFERTDEAEAPKSSAHTQPEVSRTWAAVYAVLLGMAIAVAFVAGAPNTWGAEIYTTVVGEQRQVKLKDGSLVYLNTNSQIHVRYTAAVREVQLLRGEALFTVERNPQRPFRVSTGTAVVQAVGTAFNVYRQPARTLIEVVKGEVNVQSSGKEDPAQVDGGNNNPGSPASVTPQTTNLKSGDTASVDLAGQIRKNAPNIQLAEDWQHRRLVFNGEPVTEAAAEFNRYNQAQIVVEGKEVGSQPVEGIFSADHPQALILFLKLKYKRVVVDSQNDKIVIRFRPQDGS